MVLYRLEPVGTGAEHLKVLTMRVRKSQLPPPPLVLGRNLNTGADSLATAQNVQFVSRSHLQVSIEGEKVFLRPISREADLVYLNGHPLPTGVETEMKPCDRISLLGRLDCFNYVLSIGDDTVNLLQPPVDGQVIALDLSSSPAPTTARKTSTVQPVPDATTGGCVDEVIVLEYSPLHLRPPLTLVAAPDHSGIIKALLQQYECAVCMQTMACVATLSPCGDNFCFACIEDCSRKNNRCPLCQTTFEISRALPNRIVESSIREILKNEQGVLIEWEARVAQGLERRKAVSGMPSSSSSSGSTARAPIARPVLPASLAPPPMPLRFVSNTSQPAPAPQARRPEVVDLTSHVIHQPNPNSNPTPSGPSLIRFGALPARSAPAKRSRRGIFEDLDRYDY